MRETTKMITLPIGDEMMTFRLTKLDAFSGGQLLKLLSAAQGKADGSLTLYDFLFSLEDAEFEAWGVPELEYETRLCLKLTLEVMAFSLESFFPGSGSTSSHGAGTSSRQSR